MRKTIIHVGLHKTATTFLQQNVWSKISGYTYLTRPYTQHNHAFNQLQYADDSLYKKDLVAKELEQISASQLLISDESFSGKPIYFSYLNRTIIAKRLADLFPNAEIILFLRDQKDIILSHYSSYIKMPYGTKKMEQFFYRPKTNYTYTDYLENPHRYEMDSLYYNTNDYFIHLDCFKYSPIISLYSSLFEKCHVFLYEDFKDCNKEVILALEQIIGKHIHIESTERKNISLSFKELERFRKINLIPPISNNRYLRRLAQVAMKFDLSTQNKDLKTLAQKIAGTYYSEDNRLLKEILPHLGWNRYPEKYT